MLLPLSSPDDAEAQLPAHLDTALTYVGTQEQGSNHGPEIKRFLSAVNLTQGYPYCAAFIAYSLDAPPDPPDRPTVRSALAQDYITDRSIPAKYIRRGLQVPSGALAVWQKGQTIKGHIGTVIYWNGIHGKTIEANTSAPTVNGSQREGDGVYIRWRSIYPANYFRITDFTLVKYEQKK